MFDTNHILFPHLALSLQAGIVQDGVARRDVLQVPSAAAAALILRAAAAAATTTTTTTAVFIGEGEEQRAALEELDCCMARSGVGVRREAADGLAGGGKAIPQAGEVRHGAGGVDIAVAD